MEYTLANAAKAAQVNKSTVLRAIKAGRLSARREEDGTYRVDASELARVYDLHHLARSMNGAMPHGAPASPVPAPEGAGGESDLLRLELRLLREQLDREREDRGREREEQGKTVDDLRRRLDRAEERVLALSVAQEVRTASTISTAPPDTVSEALAPIPSRPPTRGGFLARLLSWK